MFGGREGGRDELGQLARSVLWLRWGARKLGRHIRRVPSLGSPALAVWHPGCPTGRDRKLPPTLGSLPWHRPDLFSSSEQLPLSAGQRRLAPVCSRAGASARAPLTPSLPTQALVSPSSPHPYPRKRRSQSWKSTWMNSWTWRAMIPGLPGSR